MNTLTEEVTVAKPKRKRGSKTIERRTYINTPDQAKEEVAQYIKEYPWYADLLEGVRSALRDMDKQRSNHHRHPLA